MSLPLAEESDLFAESPVFGTDGVRGRPGEGYLEGKFLEGLLVATATVLERPGPRDRDFPERSGASILIGRDTRSSGPDLVGVVSDVFSSRGYTVVDLGVLPTPGVAYLAAKWPGVAMAVVVSASHNPADYNGIKYFAPSGAKVSSEFESAVEAVLRSGPPSSPSAVRGRSISREEEAFEAYVAFLASSSSSGERLLGRDVVLDTANGATCRVAPEVFRRLGLRVRCLGDQPDGSNINEGCGALEPWALSERVQESNAELGFAFDGDGDRMIPVTAGGTVLDGDHVLYLCGSGLLREGRLPQNKIVATVMSNLGLETALRRLGVDLLRTGVGDRNVYRAMVAEGHPLGGEQSGHVIFLDDARTGDGTLAAIRCLDSLGDSFDLESDALHAVPRFPQLLRNVPVVERRSFSELPALEAAIREARATLGENGRVLVRYSGTEPLLRIMVEAIDHSLVESLTESICRAIPRELRP